MHTVHACKVCWGPVQVVEWVLGGVRTEWQSPAFQAALASPAAFIAHYIDLHADAAGHAEVPLSPFAAATSILACSSRQCYCISHVAASDGLDIAPTVLSLHLCFTNVMLM